MDQSADKSQPPTYECSSTEEFKNTLQELLQSNANCLIPEPIAVDFVLGPNVTLTGNVFHLGKDESSSENKNGKESTSVNRSKSTVQVLTVLNSVNNQPEEKPEVQRALSRAITNIFSEFDGFGWTMRNCSSSKDGWRVQYACHDSFQNKDRKENQARTLKAGTSRAIVKENPKEKQQNSDSDLCKRQDFRV